jgi:hypothetical protein
MKKGNRKDYSGKKIWLQNQLNPGTWNLNPTYYAGIKAQKTQKK